ncbi:hypothetical protein TRVL_10387 [Trypanosoma vivax]|nr:hypothetical protein TRVL_10387 [Trypanosoma vivax]
MNSDGTPNSVALCVVCNSVTMASMDHFSRLGTGCMGCVPFLLFPVFCVVAFWRVVWGLLHVHHWFFLCGDRRHTNKSYFSTCLLIAPDHYISQNPVPGCVHLTSCSLMLLVCLICRIVLLSLPASFKRQVAIKLSP